MHRFKVSYMLLWAAGLFYSGQWQAQSAYTYDSASRLATASLPLANVSATCSRDIANSPLLRKRVTHSMDFAEKPPVF